MEEVRVSLPVLVGARLQHSLGRTEATFEVVIRSLKMMRTKNKHQVELDI
jgi:hypothetical protein